MDSCKKLYCGIKNTINTIYVNRLITFGTPLMVSRLKLDEHIQIKGSGISGPGQSARSICIARLHCSFGFSTDKSKRYCALVYDSRILRTNWLMRLRCANENRSHSERIYVSSLQICATSGIVIRIM